MIPPDDFTGPGVEPFPAGPTADRWRSLAQSLLLDARLALGWAGRGHLATSPYFPLLVRRRVLRLSGVDMGPTVDGLISCYFGSPNVTIEDGTYVGPRTWFEGSGRIFVGVDCLIGPEVMFVTSATPAPSPGWCGRAVDYLDITVEPRCWLGARATLLPGVRIGEGTVVAAGAVVVKDCDAGGVYAGVPAKRVR